MPTIGSFSQDDLFGQEGVLETATLKAKVKFVPLRERTGNQPDYRILSGKRELGAAWSRTSKKGAYLFLKIACQTARKRDPGSACKRDPSVSDLWACPGSEQEGPARSGVTATSPTQRSAGGTCLPTWASPRGWGPGRGILSRLRRGV